MFPIAANRSDEENTTPYSDDVFSTTLYTGNGSTQTITNGIDLAGKGGLVWIKDRTADASMQAHFLFDTNRGTSAGYVSSNSTSQANPYPLVNSFNSNGFGFNPPASDAGYNWSSWTFRKAAKFFDVVTYTGTGSAQTIAHSLGVAPGMIIVKSTSALGSWVVYNRGVNGGTNPQNYGLTLNATAAQYAFTNFWNNTAPTASVFTVGASTGETNETGVTYVAYLFAHDTSSTGIIQCGSCTGSAQVELGWEPQYLLIKAATTTDNWQVYDTMRGWTTDGNEALLVPNTSNAEVSTTTPFRLNATGFKPSVSVTDTYIYIAIRRPNKPPTSGTQVFSPATRTGDGTTGVVVTDATFPVDLAIGRGRSTSSPTPVWIDRLRGATRQLRSDNADTEAASTIMSSLASQTGWIGSTGGSGSWNVSSVNYIQWYMRRAPGFFDVICYTGAGSAPFTTYHNLTVVPTFMIFKSRTDATENWFVEMPSIGVGLELNNTSANHSSNIPVPTATTITANDTRFFLTGKTYVAYLFATLAGISKVGSYTGNGSTGQAIACGFSAGARFVLIKRYDSIGEWYVYDSARGLTVGSSPYLNINSTAAEITGNNGVYQSAGGFTLGSTASTTTNINAATYIFLAIA